MRLVVLLACLSACRVEGTFVCGADQACRDGLALGKCEADGYCSFADTDCASGRRYEENAGAAVAGTCVDDAPPSCLDRWRMGLVTFEPLFNLGVSSPMAERDPIVSQDELQLHFTSDRSGGAGGDDLYKATRTSRTATFAAPTRETAWSTAMNDARLSAMADATIVTVTSDRTGGEGSFDVWNARKQMDGTHGAFDQVSLGEVNTPDNERDGFLSRDGLSLYFAGAAVGAPLHLMRATRPAIADNFAAPEPLYELNTGAGETDPMLAPGGLLLLFTSRRTGPDIPGGGNLWYSARSTVADPWQPPLLVPSVGSDSEEADPFVSADGCTLYFARTQAADPANWELVSATMGAIQ